MRDFLKRIRLPALLIFLVLLTVLSMLEHNDFRQRINTEGNIFQRLLLDAARPLQNLIKVPSRFISGAWEDYVFLIDLKNDNDRLREKVLHQEQEIFEYKEALVSSGHLQRIAEMRSDFEVPLLPAKIVGQDVSPWFRSVLLERGINALVQKGMPVVADAGLVGIITATSPNTSRAMLILDRQSSLSGIIQRSRTRGIVRGDGTRALDFVLMVEGDDVEEGDVVLTSGIDGIYPKGLVIGKILKMKRDKESLVQIVQITPSVDFGRMEQVFVMEKRGPTMNLLYGVSGKPKIDTLGDQGVQ